MVAVGSGDDRLRHRSLGVPGRLTHTDLEQLVYTHRHVRTTTVHQARRPGRVGAGGG